MIFLTRRDILTLDPLSVLSGDNMLKGPRVELRTIQTGDAPLMYRWHNDPRVASEMGMRHTLFATSMEEERTALQRIVTTSSEQYLIIQLKGGRPIGYTSLARIDLRNASARLTVVIGEPAEWGNGYGKEVTSLLTNYAFNVLNIHRLYLRVPDYNQRAIRCFTACGFQKEGTLRDDHFHLGSYRSSHLMSILREECQR